MAAKTQADTTPPVTIASPPAVTGLVQRKCACGGSAGLSGECEECSQKRPQRDSRTSPGVTEAPPVVQDVVRAPGQPLDEDTRAFFEPRFGHNFSGVRIHTDATAASTANALSARAYTVGQNIAFAAGQYRPATEAGLKLIAHELTHTVQQTHGGDGRAESPGAEREAERNAGSVVSPLSLFRVNQFAAVGVARQKTDEGSDQDVQVTTSAGGRSRAGAALRLLEKSYERYRANPADSAVREKYVPTILQFMQDTVVDSKMDKAFLTLDSDERRTAQSHCREALDQMKLAVKLAPDEAEYWYSLGLAYRETADLTGAIAALEKAVQLDAQAELQLQFIADVRGGRGRTDIGKPGQAQV